MRSRGAAFVAILVAAAGARGAAACASFSADDDAVSTDGGAATDAAGGGEAAAEASIEQDAATNGYKQIYVVAGEIAQAIDGGTSPQFTSSVLYTSQQSDGGLSKWLETMPVSSPTHGNAVVASARATVSLGGEVQTPFTDPSGSATPGTSRAAVTADGGLDTWQPTTNLPQALYFHAAVALNERVYVIGGSSIGPGALMDVQFASMSAEGSLAMWTTTKPLPQGRRESVAITNGKYIYVVGGSTDNGSTCAKEILVGTVDAATGEVTAWTPTTSVVQERSPAVAIYKDKLYVMGGYGCSGGHSPAVQMAAIRPDGTLGDLARVQDLPGGRTGHGAAILGHYLYVVGGIEGTDTKSDVFVADLEHNGGVIDAWTTTTPLPVARAFFGIAAH